MTSSSLLQMQRSVEGTDSKRNMILGSHFFISTMTMPEIFLLLLSYCLQMGCDRISNKKLFSTIALHMLGVMHYYSRKPKSTELVLVTRESEDCRSKLLCGSCAKNCIPL